MRVRGHGCGSERQHEHGHGRSRAGRAAAIAALTASLLAGCAFSVEVQTQGADKPGNVATAAEPLPVRAILQPGGGAAISRTLKARLDESKLFREVVDLSVGHGGDRTLRQGDVIVRIAPAAVVDYDSGFPARAVFTGILFGVFAPFGVVMVPFDVVFQPQPDIEIPYKLMVLSRDGKVLHEWTTRQRVGINAQAFASDTEMLDAAHKAAEDAAERVLISRLALDTNAHKKIRDGALGGPPDLPPGITAVTPTTPTPPAPGAPFDLQAVPATQGRTFVLIVGINSYVDTTIPNLSFAQADARSMYGFFATDRRSPTDADRVQMLIGADATRQNVLRAIREHLIQKAVAPNDTAILFFAGHGFADQNETYLATSDTELQSLPETAIALTTLRTYWGRIQAGRKILITDACHSGGLAGLRGIGGVVARPGASADGTPDPFQGSVTIAATGPNQLSMENSALGQGVFTNALLNGLRGDADQDKDGKVTLAELQTYLANEVRRQAKVAGGDQTPVLSVPDTMKGLELTR